MLPHWPGIFSRFVFASESKVLIGHNGMQEDRFFRVFSCTRPSLSTSSLSMEINSCVGGRSRYVRRAEGLFLAATISLLRGSLSSLALFVKGFGVDFSLGFHILPGWHFIATTRDDQGCYIVGYRVSFMRIKASVGHLSHWYGE